MTFIATGSRAIGSSDREFATVVSKGGSQQSVVEKKKLQRSNQEKKSQQSVTEKRKLQRSNQEEELQQSVA